jgi:septal ring factor EnvC (AmiA/AmiB activator)
MALKVWEQYAVDNKQLREDLDACGQVVVRQSALLAAKDEEIRGLRQENSELAELLELRAARGRKLLAELRSATEHLNRLLEVGL